MLCKIADLTVEIPEAGGMAPRCKDYLLPFESDADIVIEEALYDFVTRPEVPRDTAVYIQSGLQFYRGLLKHEGMMLHSSAVECDGYAYLFSGPSRVGKSTHTGLWLENFENVRIINDDKPALRCIDGKWYAYGTPWSGKHSINLNVKVPLGGICFLEQGTENSIRRLEGIEAVVNIIGQTTRKNLSRDRMNCLLNTIEKMVAQVPMFLLSCLPDREAAELSYMAMSRAAREIGNEN